MSAVTVAPANASMHRSLRGNVDLDFNLGLVLGEGAAQNVSWFGTVEFRGGTYDIAYYPTAPLVEHGNWIYFEDRYEIYDSLTYEYENGILTEFNPGTVVLEASERGWGTPWGTAFAFGKVVAFDADVDPHDLLARVQVGDRTFWRGRYLDETQLEFAGPFRIFPTAR